MRCSCVFQREDEKSNVGVELNKDLVKVSSQIDVAFPNENISPSRLRSDKSNYRMQD